MTEHDQNRSSKEKRVERGKKETINFMHRVTYLYKQQEYFDDLLFAFLYSKEEILSISVPPDKFEKLSERLGYDVKEDYLADLNFVKLKATLRGEELRKEPYENEVPPVDMPYLDFEVIEKVYQAHKLIKEADEKWEEWLNKEVLALYKIYLKLQETMTLEDFFAEEDYFAEDDYWSDNELFEIGLDYVEQLGRYLLDLELRRKG